MSWIKSILFIGLIVSGFLYFEINWIGDGPECHDDLEVAYSEWLRLMDENDINVKKKISRLKYIWLFDSEELAGITHVGASIVAVNRDVIEAGPYSVNAVLYHELGHYVFDLKHDDGIMRWSSYSEEFYKENWESLINEYLNSCKNHEGIIFK